MSVSFTALSRIHSKTRKGQKDTSVLTGCLMPWGVNREGAKLSYVALGKVNLIRAFTSKGYKIHFFWLTSAVRDQGSPDKAAQPVPAELLDLLSLVLPPFSSASPFIYQCLKSFPQPVLPTISSSGHPSLSGFLTLLGLCRPFSDAKQKSHQDEAI